MPPNLITPSYVNAMGRDCQALRLIKSPIILMLVASLASISYATAASSKLVADNLVVHLLQQDNNGDYAKRSPPEEVSPVVHGDEEYVVIHMASQNGAYQNGGYIEAQDRKTGATKWGIKVYTTINDPDGKSEQDVFITEMKLNAATGVLLVKDEKKRSYSVNINTRQVTVLQADQDNPAVNDEKPQQPTEGLGNKEVRINAEEKIEKRRILSYFAHRNALWKHFNNEKNPKGWAKKCAQVGSDSFVTNNNYIAWAVSNATVDVNHIVANGGLELVGRYQLPEGNTVKTLAMSGDILYLTGDFGAHHIGMVDIRNGMKDPIVPIQIPEKVKKKAFDDLLIDGDSMIAVDDKISPKWLVFYDIHKPSNPQWVWFCELDVGLNERVIKGALNTKCLALLCLSAHRGGENQTMHIYDREKGYKKVREIRLWSWDRQTGEETGNKCNVPDVSFAGKYLLLPGYNNGVGVVDCSMLKAADNNAVKMLAYREKETLSKIQDAIAMPGGKNIAIWESSQNFDSNPRIIDLGDLDLDLIPNETANGF